MNHFKVHNDGYIKSNKFQKTQDGDLVAVFLFVKRQNVMLDLLDGFYMTLVLMYQRETVQHFCNCI